MPNKLIKDLIGEGAVILKEQGYSIRSSEYTLLTWRQFQEFCNDKGYKMYSSSHKDEFIAGLGNCTPPLRQSTIDRKAGSMKMLDLLATKGNWEKGMLNPLKELLPEFSSFLDAQDEYLIKTGYSECSRETMRDYISLVMRHFQNAGATELAELNGSHILAYLLTLRGHAKSTVRLNLSVCGSACRICICSDIHLKILLLMCLNIIWDKHRVWLRSGNRTKSMWR